MTSNTAAAVASTMGWLTVGLAVAAFVKDSGQLWVWAAIAAGISLAVGAYGWLQQHKEGGRP